ncbi:MAG: HAD-IIB family hydrolase [Candidatus Nomurabacteria bacterium]|jgi:HAD superfamily hydrolase (TIGR01484 family)|nr:HAD-IIB family hydrolase [Candidatus Nomurabacteria bacterium]
MKKVLSFDLDDTLSLAKLPMEPEMAKAFGDLLEYYDMCVISGAMFSQIKKQVVDVLNVPAENLKRLHVMASQGTKYWRFQDGEWKVIYADDLAPEKIAEIFKVLEESAKEAGYWCKNPAGEIIENRDNTQVTMSAIGQKARKEDKYAWDPDHKKREAIVKIAREKMPDLEFGIGGTTSIDVTMPGVNKAYGMRKLMENNDLEKSDILFFGDMTQVGGNDYPVAEMGIDTITVKNWQETVNVLKGILAVS